MRIQDQRKKISIYFNSHDKYEGQPLLRVLLEELLKLHVAGLSVFKTHANAGRRLRLHLNFLYRFLMQRRGILVQIIETEKKAEEILKLCDRIMPNGIVTLEDVTMIRYKKIAVSREDEALAQNYKVDQLGHVETEL
ncbi:MAG: DUF190 domain-containing protein [Leptospiraceae bacterium]|nr:DUF190 domain-containing protein [Leptospiraceae bacterium]MDW8306363.1 DUF190 domain-containing protein [Leptospiraceae bacterium]